MKAHVGGWPGLHRFSLWNGIFYVRQRPARRPGLRSIVDPLPAPEPEPEPEPEPARQPVSELTLQAEAQPEPEPDYEAGSEPEPVYELLPQPEPYYQPEPDANPDPGPDPWPARTAPPDGYAYEFGTGRLVLAALNPATGLRGYNWSRY